MTIGLFLDLKAKGINFLFVFVGQNFVYSVRSARVFGGKPIVARKFGGEDFRPKIFLNVVTN